MSLDVFVACAVSAALPSPLPRRVAWQREEEAGNVWFVTGNFNEAWQLTVWIEDEPRFLQDFELPPGKKHLVGFSLEGPSADNGFALLEKAVDAVTKSCDGVLLDI